MSTGMYIIRKSSCLRPVHMTFIEKYNYLCISGPELQQTVHRCLRSQISSDCSQQRLLRQLLKQRSEDGDLQKHSPSVHSGTRRIVDECVVEYLAHVLCKGLHVASVFSSVQPGFHRAKVQRVGHL